MAVPYLQPPTAKEAKVKFTPELSNTQSLQRMKGEARNHTGKVIGEERRSEG